MAEVVEVGSGLGYIFQAPCPLNPPKVSAPAPVHAAESRKQANERAHPIIPTTNPFPTQKGKQKASQTTLPMQPDSNTNTTICPNGLQLLQRLEAAANQISSDVPSAAPKDPLSIFMLNPSDCIAEDGEDDWPILNSMLKSSFGWGEREMAAAIPQMLKHGEYGLDGFIKFMKYFVVERGLQGVMFETKVDALVRELEQQ
jgi:hypothetical protein